MNLPNALTLIRLLLSPIFLLLYIYGNHIPYVPFLLMGIFFLSELSDAFDGYFARKYGQVTDLGKLIDPMADSIARSSAFLAFTAPPISLPIVIVFLLIYRDSVVGTLRTICALKGFALAARTSGKVKAIIQAVAIFVILLLWIFERQGAISLQQLQQTSLVVAAIAALYSILSGIEYIAANRKFIGF